MRRIAVLGIGNVLLRDDGIGVEVAKQLMGRPWPDNVAIIDAGTAILSLLGVFTDCETILVVDALRGGYEPGTIYRLTPEQLGAWQSESLSLHDIQVLDVKKMAAMFGKNPDVIIYGIEPYSLKLGLGLSDQMTERLPVLFDRVERELNELLQSAEATNRTKPRANYA